MGVAFLPGASGRREYWAPVANRLRLTGDMRLFGWPGFLGEPTDSRVLCLTDLVDWVSEQLQGPTDLVAQSMGGVVALMFALSHPGKVRRLVLAGTSGGLDLEQFGAADWREDYRREMGERAPSWFVDDRSDLRGRLGTIETPALLIWGQNDRTSPPAVGKYLAGLLPSARFELVPESGHMVAEERPDQVAALIQSFLEAD